MSNQLFDLDRNLTIEIPLHDSLFAGLKYALRNPNKEHNIAPEKRLYPFILDGFKNPAGYYRILYLYDKKLHLMDFDETSVLMDKVISNPAHSHNSFSIFMGQQYLLSHYQGDKFLSLKFIE